jgi:hypothetical protein
LNVFVLFLCYGKCFYENAVFYYSLIEFVSRLCFSEKNVRVCENKSRFGKFHPNVILCEQEI